MTAVPASTPLIMHVVHRFDVGGLENGVVNLINRLPTSKWRHAILSLTEVSQSFATRIDRDDVELISLGKQSGHLFFWYPELYRLFRKFRPAIVHTRNLAALEASVAAWAARVPVRIHGEHGWDVADPDGSVRKYQLIRRVYRPFVHRYVALSGQIKQYLEDRVTIPSDSITQIYNGVDVGRFATSGLPRQRAEGCPFRRPDDWIVGTVGRLEQVKDQANLARAFVRAIEQDSRARRHMRLMIVGAGSMQDEVKGILDRAGLSELAWFPGSRSDVPEVMRSMDCFVLPSISEGISNTILEAMATALPIIATKVGGNGELIEAGLSGQLVPPSDHETMAESILKYFHDPVTARRHGKTARRVVEDRFSLDRMVTDYNEMYVRMLNARGGVVAPSSSAGMLDRHNTTHWDR